MAFRVKGLLLLTPLLLATSVLAQEIPKQISKYNCLGCHAVDQKIVGPSYKEIATKYRGQKDAEALLMKEVRSGTQGKWGKIAMPPQQIADEDLKIIMHWILTQ